MVDGLAMRALDKLYGQPSIVAYSLTTQSAPSACSLLPVPGGVGHPHSAQSPPHEGQQRARRHYQCLMFQQQCVGTSSIL